MKFIVTLYFFGALSQYCTASSDDIRWIPRMHWNTTDYLQPAGFSRTPSTLHLYFVARANHLNGTIPGSVSHSAGTSLSFDTPISLSQGSTDDGVVFIFNGVHTAPAWEGQYELLAYPTGSLLWVQVSESNVLSNLVMFPGGVNPQTGESMYVCRAWNEFDLLVGYAPSDLRHCVVAWGSRQISKRQYDVLVYHTEAGTQAPVDPVTEPVTDETSVGVLSRLLLIEACANYTVIYIVISSCVVIVLIVLLVTVCIVRRRLARNKLTICSKGGNSYRPAVSVDCDSDTN